MGKKSKTTVKPWKEAQPYIMNAANTVQSTYNANQPRLQAMSDQLSGYMPQIAERAFGSNPNLDAAKSYNADVLNGVYLGQGNPYLQDMLDRTGNSVADRVNGTFSSAGRTGGSRHAGELASGVAEAENALRYGDYSAERGRMDSAVGAAAGLNATDNANLASYLDAMQTGAQLPYLGSQFLSSGISGLLSPYTTQTQGMNAAGNIANGVGTALQAASLFSDVRLKENIRRVGQTDGGLPIYVYNYIGDGTPQMGVMAQEVAAVQPNALGPVVDGFMTVQYGGVQ